MKPWLLCENTNGSEGVEMIRHILGTFWYGFLFFWNVATGKDKFD
ncbi:MAG: hypothetical protein V1690_03660 [Candidatus Moraniibacteriota bacterium]